MKLTPPVLIFESIPMDLGDLGGRAGGRAGGRTDGRTDGRTGTDAMAECARSDTARTFWHASHSLTHLAHSISTSDPKLEDYPYKPSSTLQNILCCHEAEKQNGHHSPYFII